MEIVLERPDAIFEVGDLISGELRVSSQGESLRVMASIHLEWHAHGAGEPASEPLASETLASGWVGPANQYMESFAVGDGTDYVEPFSFRLPKSARTYAGRNFVVELRLRAEAEVSSARRERLETIVPLRVAAAPAPTSFHIAPVSETHEPSPSGAGGSLGAVVLGAGLVALGGVAHGVFLVGGATLALAGMARGWIKYKRALARHRVGTVSVSTEREGGLGYRDQPGSAPLAATVTTAARGATVAARLRVQESSSRRASGTVATHTEPLYDVTVELSDERTPGTFRGRIRVPAPGEVPLPLTRGLHRIEWDLFVTIEPPGMAAWVQRYELDVTS